MNAETVQNTRTRDKSSQGTIKQGRDLFQPIPCRKKQRLTLGQRWADRIAKWGGSWYFISFFILYLLVWMALNTYFVLTGAWDPYPFILLNLTLSCLAAMQAPVILMSQNRQVDRDRHRGELDYYVNRRAEREIKLMQRELLEIKSMISKTPKEEEIKRIEGEIKTIQKELEESIHQGHFNK